MDNVKSISASEFVSFAIQKDGSLWAWGWDFYGQFGIGKTSITYRPIKIMDNVDEVSAGDEYTMILRFYWI